MQAILSYCEEIYFWTLDNEWHKVCFMGRNALSPSSPLTERQAAFITNYIETGSATEAICLSGYSGSNPRAESWRLMNAPHIAQAIAAAARKRFATLVPMALKVVEDLAEKGATERVRLDAAKTLLDRAGHVAPKAKEDRSASDTPLHEMSTDDLRNLATRLEDEIAGRAKPVLSATAAPLDQQPVDLIG